MKTVLILGILFAVGCGSSDSDIAKMRNLKDDVCTSRDREARMMAAREMAAIGAKLKDKAADLSNDQRQEVARIAREAIECTQNGPR
jgi:vacuolar-type H+-ATPase subunit H